MWYEINNDNDLLKFMDKMDYFHDSCIKEVKYLSGAYVNNDLGMYPVNDKRELCVIIQRQFETNSMIELKFEGLKFLNLYPVDDKYTCEILDSTMILKNDCVIWCDSGNLSESDIEKYDGTKICSSRLKWRVIEKCMGQNEFYKSIK